jgi:hypothetical protein
MNKRKSLKNIRFSIEIEAIFKNSKISEELIAKNRVIRGWEIEYDYSLESKKTHEIEGAEYRPKDSNKLYFNSDSISQLKEITALIKVHKGHVDERCGGHIHIDMKNFSNKEICNILQAFTLHQEDIIKKFKVLPNRLRKHALRIPKKCINQFTPETVKRIRKGESWGEGYFSDRHYLLNVDALRRHKTLEFRLFNGTVDVDKIKKNVKWVLEFCLKYSKEV